MWSRQVRIFDVPRDYLNGNPPCRIAIIGSCRVYDPVENLVNAQEITRTWGNYKVATYTAGEVVQILKFTLKELDIPQNFLPLIVHDPNAMPAREDLHRRLFESVDSFII